MIAYCWISDSIDTILPIKYKLTLIEIQIFSVTVNLRDEDEQVLTNHSCQFQPRKKKNLSS
jgi:hypothetical protein